LGYTVSINDRTIFALSFDTKREAIKWCKEVALFNRADSENIYKVYDKDHNITDVILVELKFKHIKVPKFK
jgi:hypothetical protein